MVLFWLKNKLFIYLAKYFTIILDTKQKGGFHMSVINKEPFIRKLIASLTSEQKATLAALVNGGGNQTPILRTLSINPAGNRTNITNSDKGVKLCDLEINYSLFRGYLIFNNSYCVLISFTDSQKLSMFKISEDKHNFATVDEELSVLELRLELFDLGEGVTEAELNDAILGAINNTY